MFKSVFHLFFPEMCLGCNETLVSNEKNVCTSCRHHIPLTMHHLQPNNEIVQRFYGRLPLQHAVAIAYFHKTGIMQELIHNLKYKGQQNVGTFLAEWYAETLMETHKNQSFDAIIPVPIHKKRLKQRGYNQLTTFCNALSKSLNIPVKTNVLHRNTYTETQTKKNLLLRNEIQNSTFGVTYTEKEHNQHFLLIDDVITTGATLETCGKALLQIPNAKLSIVCMAISQG